MLKKLALRPFWIQALIISSPIILLVLIPILLKSFKELEPYFMGLFLGQTFVLFFFFLFGWQYYLGILSLKEMEQKASFFKINGMIPVIIWGLSVLLSLIGDIIIPSDYLAEEFNTPMDNEASSRYNYYMYFMNFTILHGVITLLLNPYLIKRAYRNYEKESMIDALGTEDSGLDDKGKNLPKRFIRSMRLLSILPFILIFAMMIFILINDLFELTS